MKNYLKIFLALSLLIAPIANINAADEPWSDRVIGKMIDNPLATIVALLSLLNQIRIFRAQPKKGRPSAKELEVEAQEKLKNAQTLEEKVEAETLLDDARRLKELEIAEAKQHLITQKMVEELEYEQAKKTLSEFMKNKPQGESLANQSGAKPA